MMQYDGDLKLPANYLVPPPEISHVSGEYLVRNGLSTFACSETQKFGHVTFFWNGNRSGYLDAKLEQYLEVCGVGWGGVGCTAPVLVRCVVGGRGEGEQWATVGPARQGKSERQQGIQTCSGNGGAGWSTQIVPGGGFTECE